MSRTIFIITTNNIQMNMSLLIISIVQAYKGTYKGRRAQKSLLTEGPLCKYRQTQKSLLTEGPLQLGPDVIEGHETEDCRHERATTKYSRRHPVNCRHAPTPRQRRTGSNRIEQNRQGRAG